MNSQRHMKLRDVCELINGRAYKKSELLSRGKYPVLRVGNFFTNDHWYYSDLELNAKNYCDSGDLLYAWSASFGPRIWQGGKVIFHYHIWKVVPRVDLIDQRYLLYFFQWDVDRIKEDSGAGTTMLHVSKGSMEEREIPVPNLSEQGRIVAILDEAFSGIATAKANAEKSLRNSQEVFETHLQSSFSGREDDWSKKTLGEIADFRNGINFTKASKGRQVRVLGVKDFQNNFHAPDAGLDRVTIDGNLDTSDFLQTGDIVFVRSNGNPELIGRSVVIEGMSEETAHSGFTIRGRPRSKEVLPQYLGHFLKSSAVRRQMVDGGTGTNIKSLNQGTLSRLVVPYPPRAEQLNIVDRLEEVQAETRHLASLYTRKLAALDDLKQSLLQRAFSGQLT